jgi:diguanylate cyclase (GGDEF)-like protein
MLSFDSFLTQVRRINRAHWVIVALGLFQVAYRRPWLDFEFQMLGLCCLVAIETLTFEWGYRTAQTKAGQPDAQKFLLNLFLIQVTADITLFNIGAQFSGGPVSVLPLVAALYVGVTAAILPSGYLTAAVIYQMLLFFGLMESYRQGLLAPIYRGPVVISSNASTFITWMEINYIFMLSTITLLISASTRQLRKAWEQSEKERTFLDHFSRIIEEVLTTPENDDLYQVLADHIGKVLGSDSVYITRWDDEDDETIPVAAFGSMRDSYRQSADAVHHKNTVTRNLRLIKKPLIIEDVFNTPFLDPAIAAQYPTKSVLGLPLFDYPDRRFSGAVLLGYDSPHKFTDDEVRRAQQAANLINLINNRMRLQRDAVERATLMQELIGQISTLTTEMKQEALIPAVVDAARSLLKAQRAALYLFEQDTDKLQYVYSVGLSQVYIEKMSQVVRQLPGASILGSQKQVMIADIALDERARPLYELFNAEGFRSYYVFSMESTTSEVGALVVYWDYPHTMSVDETSIARLFTDRAAAVLRQSYLYQQVAEQSLTDPLTSLPNRRALDIRLREEIQRATRYSRPFAFIMLDLNGFKKINDTFGHLTGDAVLKRAAMVIHSMLRSTDMAARFGGDEFAIILPETDSPAAENVWKKIHTALKMIKLDLPKAGELSISASMGIAIYPDDAATSETLVEIADKRLYHVKSRGPIHDIPPD